MKDEEQKMRDELNEIHCKMQALFTIIGNIYGLLCDLDEVIESEQSQ